MLVCFVSRLSCSYIHERHRAAADGSVWRAPNGEFECGIGVWRVKIEYCIGLAIGTDCVKKVYEFVRLLYPSRPHVRTPGLRSSLGCEFIFNFIHMHAICQRQALRMLDRILDEITNHSRFATASLYVHEASINKAVNIRLHIQVPVLGVHAVAEHGSVRTSTRVGSGFFSALRSAGKHAGRERASGYGAVYGARKHAP
jgi:hypothetical protein